MGQISTSKVQVLLLPPNLISYLRLVLLSMSLVSAQWGRFELCLHLSLVGFCLDGIDGWVARRYNTASTFGAWLDVAVDIISRAFLWTGMTGYTLMAVCVVMLESLTFVCTHQVTVEGKQHWKDTRAQSKPPPKVVAAVLANGFRNPTGCLTVFGLFGCPLWLAARHLAPGTMIGWWGWGIIVVPGRALAAVVECWFIGDHLGQLLQRDAEAITDRKRIKR